MQHCLTLNKQLLTQNRIIKTYIVESSSNETATDTINSKIETMSMEKQARESQQRQQILNFMDIIKMSDGWNKPRTTIFGVVV